MAQPEPTSTDELQMRAFWRKWHALLMGNEGFADCDDRPAQPVAQAQLTGSAG